MTLIKRYPILFLLGFALCCVLLGIGLGISFHDDLFRLRCQLIGETFTEVSTQSLKVALEFNLATVNGILDKWSANKDFEYPCDLLKLTKCYIDNHVALARIAEGHQNIIFDDNFKAFVDSCKVDTTVESNPKK